VADDAGEASGASEGVTALTVPSASLGEDVNVLLLRSDFPTSACGASPEQRPRWVWLLPGRGACADDTRPVLKALDDAVARGRLGSLVVAVVDGPWSRCASWWVDSSYAGSAEVAPGRPVETAVLKDVLPDVERRYGAPLDRQTRTIAGISMGGAGALRWALVQRGLFGSALLLSPAVYDTPPPTSSARDSGAFGVGHDVYSGQRWNSTMSYSALLDRRPVQGPPTRVVTLVGDDETVQDTADGRPADLTLQAARLHAVLQRRADIDSSLRIVGGGHDWSTWAQGVVTGVQLLDRGRRSG